MLSVPQLLTYLAILTPLVAVAAAAYRGLPILYVFAPVNTWPALWLGVAAFGVITSLVVFQAFTWAMLVALIYCWGTIGYQLRQA